MCNRYDWLCYEDVRTILDLVHELHSLPADGDGRRRRMLEGLCDLVGADAAESAVVRPDGPPGDRVLSTLRVGGERWAPPRALIAGGSGPRGAAGADAVVDRLLVALGRRREANATVTRTQRGRADAGGRYDVVYSARALGVNVAVLCLARRNGEPFGRRESRIVQLLHSEVGWAYETPPPGPGGLTRRQQECLQCLLAGKSEKRIAADLRLSPHTVHVHVKAIYRQVGVSTRAELMAKILGTGRRASQGVGIARVV